MIEVSKAVIQEDGKYLLLRRASHSASHPDLWDFPGGKHNAGESSRESVIREVKEETSFDIEPGEEIKKVSYQDDRYDLLFHYFAPSLVSGDLKLSPDHSEYKWVGVGDLGGLKLHPSIKLFFSKVEVL